MTRVDGWKRWTVHPNFQRVAELAMPLAGGGVKAGAAGCEFRESRCVESCTVIV